MRWLAPLAGLLVSAGAWGARTPFQARCEDGMGASVAVLTARDGGYAINNNLSYQALTRIKGQGRNSVVLGLTSTESRINIGLDGQLLADRASGYECIAPRVQVALSYVPVIIYVGSEFSPGTCAYKQILAHEMRHLNAYMNHLPKVEATVRAALKRRFAGQPTYAPIGQARALLKQEMDGGWMPYIKNEMAQVESLQAAIDSPREYARLSKVCKGEVQLLIGPPKRNK